MSLSCFSAVNEYILQIGESAYLTIFQLSMGISECGNSSRFTIKKHNCVAMAAGHQITDQKIPDVRSSQNAGRTKPDPMST